MKPFQSKELFIEQVLSHVDSVAISGGERSGKTNALIEACKIIPLGKTILFAFLEHEQMDALEDNFPDTVRLMPLDNIGFHILHRNYGKVVYKKTKQLRYINKEIENLDVSDQENLSLIREKINTAINCLRMNVSDNTEEETLKEIQKDYVKAVMNVREQMIDYNITADNEIIIDAIDMLEIPVMAGMQFPEYDLVFVDDVHLLTRLSYEFVMMLKHDKCRLIFSGNPQDDKHGLFDKIANKTKAKIVELK